MEFSHFVQRRTILRILTVAFTTVGSAAAESSRPPIIDMHLHALPAVFNGTPPVKFCSGDLNYPGVDPRLRFELPDLISCPEPLWSLDSDQEIMRASLAALEEYNITAVTSGPLEHVRQWKAAAPKRIIPALLVMDSPQLTPKKLRGLIENGEVAVLGEIMTQYQGLAPDDPSLVPYLSVAEELDIPVAIHMGMGPPGAAYLRPNRYRASLTNPLLLENVLLRFPQLRLYVMHAGWPMLPEMMHLLYSHPQVYLDVGIICWGIPRKEFHRYLRQLVEAGFGKRIMFGSDQMVWPQSIAIAIDAIESADFLSPPQKRDIFYNNAARFLRLKPQR